MAKVTPTMVKLIEYITTADSRQIFSFEAGEKTINYLSRVSEEYLKAQLDRNFSTLSYLNKVKALEHSNEE